MSKKINKEQVTGIFKKIVELLKKLTTTQLLVFLLIIASFLIGVLVTKVQYLEKAQNTNAAVPTADAQQAAAPTPVKVEIATIKNLFKNKKLITFGDANRKNLFVEIADPSCPYCHVAAGLNPELNNQMGEQFKLVSDGGNYVAPVVEMRKLVDQGKASFVYIYTPGHGNGELATKAMYCANDQGKFWNVHDKLMTNEGYTLINDVVKNDKANIGQLVEFLSGTADTQVIASCLESGKYDSYLKDDQQLAGSLGVQGTPGFFINETNFAGAYSWNDMKSVIK
jgi:protein-disulfide isomerase